MTDPRIEFVRLTEVDVAAVAALLNEPRNARHMPLASAFTLGEAVGWVAAKDAQWAANGYGPWAVLVAGEFAGWCGFQAEPGGADFGLVLRPSHWGHGQAITKRALQIGFADLGLDAVLVALPHSRTPDRAMAGLGFAPDGEVSYAGARFRQYRLTHEVWSARRSRASATRSTSRPAAAGRGPNSGHAASGRS